MCENIGGSSDEVCIARELLQRCVPVVGDQPDGRKKCCDEKNAIQSDSEDSLVKKKLSQR